MGYNYPKSCQPHFLNQWTCLASSPLRIEKLNLEHASPKKLILAGTQAGLALTALWYLGKNEVKEETIAKIKAKLPAKEFEILLEKQECMPTWMAEVIMKFK